MAKEGEFSYCLEVHSCPKVIRCYLSSLTAQAVCRNKSPTSCLFDHNAWLFLIRISTEISAANWDLPAVWLWCSQGKSWLCTHSCLEQQGGDRWVVFLHPHSSPPAGSELRCELASHPSKTRPLDGVTSALSHTLSSTQCWNRVADQVTNSFISYHVGWPRLHGQGDGLSSNLGFSFTHNVCLGFLSFQWDGKRS